MKLRTKTSLLLAMIVMAVIGVLGVTFHHLVESSLRNAVFSGLEGVSWTAANHIEAWRADGLRSAGAIASNLPAKALEDQDSVALTAYLKTTAGINSQFDNGLFILDAQGILQADYPEQANVRGRSFAHRQYFQETMKQGRGVVGVPYQSARTGEPVVTVTAVLRGSDGRIAGLVGCSSRLVGPMALGGLRRQKIGKTGYLYLYDRTRLMILHPEDGRVLKRDIPPGANQLLDAAIDGYEGVGRTVNSRGIPMLISLTHVPGTDWIVAAQQPEAEAYESLRELQVRLAAGALLGAVAALLLGVLAVRGITLPLRDVYQTALQLKERYASLGLGDSSQPAVEGRFRARSRGEEIDLLSRTLSDLSAGLDITMGALKESEARYRTLFEMAQEAILVLDHEGLLVDCNPATERLFGASRDELLGCSILDLTREPGHDDRHGSEKIRHLMAMALAGTPQRFEVVHRALTGETFDAEVALGAAWVGSELGLLAVVRDISRQKQAQAQLRQEWERLAAVLDGNPIATFMIDLEGRVVLWNRACEILTQMPRGEVLGARLDLTPLFSGRERPVLALLLLEHSDEAIRDSFQGKPSVRFMPDLGILESQTAIAVEGKRRIVRASAARIRDARGSVIGVVQSARDVTHEEELKQQLLQASKMESIGTMAGGMAHEFNNILAIIQGHAQLLQLDLEDQSIADSVGWKSPRVSGKGVLNHLEQIQIGCQRAAALTRNMLAFARSEPGKMVPTGLNGVLENVQQLLSQTLPPSVELVIDLAPDLPLVMADARQLEQVVVNLVVNARDAMPEGGQVSIRTRVDSGADEGTAVLASGNGNQGHGSSVAIEIADTGSGIPVEHFDRIFDPFFTTKEPGKGTGLGLSIVYSIVTAHGGSVQVESQQPGGSCFRLQFPALGPAVKLAVGDTKAEAAVSRSGRGQSVLIVDDEEQVRRVLEAMLQAAGYRVVSATNGHEALSIYGEAMKRSTPFDLVILDLAMPVMGGRDCLMELVSMDPSVKVLLSSGLVEVDVQGEMLHNVAGILNKPFQFGDLTDAVRRVFMDRETEKGAMHGQPGVLH